MPDMPQSGHQAPKYAVDTNVIIAFMRTGENESYDKDVFPKHWDYIEKLISEGKIISAKRIEVELRKWTSNVKGLEAWLKKNSQMFLAETSGQLKFAKEIAKRYPYAAKIDNNSYDLMLIALAGDMGITVLTLENQKKHRPEKPKIPTVCDEFDVKCISLKDFFRAERFKGV